MWSTGGMIESRENMGTGPTTSLTRTALVSNSYKTM